MHHNQFQDDRRFDRLVDGELSAAERRELLGSLDDRPDGWRRCALAFLEAQCWSEELGEFARRPADAAIVENDVKASVPDALSTSPLKRHRAAWLAIAASLFLAFTLGVIWRNEAPRFTNDAVPNPQGQLAEVVPPPTVPDAQRRDDALTFWVRDETGQARRLRVPLVDAAALDRQLGLQFQTGLPPEVRSELQTRGFDVQSKRQYAPLWLENGRPMIVPVEDTKIVPVSRSVY
jgi:hypothetical protein